MTAFSLPLIILTVLGLLEFLDPGIVSTAVPLPLFGLLCFASLLWQLRCDPPLGKRPRQTLTALTAVTTLALLTPAVWQSGTGLLAAVAVSATSALAVWTLTASSYAHDPLS